jgi:serine/threonine protein kinase
LVPSLVTKHTPFRPFQKPENVGFDIRGDIKIFDFGLAKEVRDPDDEGNYKLTGYCGSPMYMAPEGKHSSAHPQK